MYAVAFFGKDENRITGKIQFYQPREGWPTLVSIKLQHVPSGFHGLHIHKWGDESQGCASMGPHFDVANNSHGSRTSKVRHTGDFGNVKADENGIVKTDFLIDVELSGKNTIVGRGIVLHKDIDDLGKGGNEESLKTGNSGPRIACAPIVYCCADK